ncbi:MAG: hypothetical protein SNG38_08890 [Rikenellaceae bacterium]
MRRSVLSLAVLLLCIGCAVTSQLERKNIGAGVKFISKELEQQKAQEHKALFEVQRDTNSNKYFLARATTDENGEQIITLDIDEVVVVAKLRVLPERKGKISLDFMISLPKELQGSCQSVTVTPLLHKGEEVEPLEDISIRGGLFTKVQGRNYWQFEQYIKVFKPNAMDEQRAFERFVKHPYPEGVRLDSIVESRTALTYYYTQEVSTEGEGKKMLLTLKGKVNGLDGSYYELPPTDTLQYSISSMLTFIDPTPRYVTKVIEKYAVVNDKNYLSFPVGKTTIVDTLGDNGEQLGRIEWLMDQLINQYEFHVDSIILTASASPEGSFALNDKLSKGRALSLKERLVDRFGSDVDTLISVRWIAEDWTELSRLITSSGITNGDKINALITSIENPDSRESAIRSKYPKEYAQIRKELYPKLRSVNFKYDLRRVGMLKDTIHTTELDSVYLRGIELLEQRKYSDSFRVLNEYRDHNCALAMMSLGYDDGAYEILCGLPQTDKTYYLRAILCSRLGYTEEGRQCFLEACNLNSTMEYRGKLDPEISNLLNDD